MQTKEANTHQKTNERTKRKNTQEEHPTQWGGDTQIEKCKHARKYKKEKKKTTLNKMQQTEIKEKNNNTRKQRKRKNKHTSKTRKGENESEENARRRSKANERRARTR